MGDRRGRLRGSARGHRRAGGRRGGEPSGRRGEGGGWGSPTVTTAFRRRWIARGGRGRAPAVHPHALAHVPFAEFRVISNHHQILPPLGPVLHPEPDEDGPRGGHRGLPGAPSRIARWVCNSSPVDPGVPPSDRAASTFRRSKPRRSVSPDDAEGEASGRRAAAMGGANPARISEPDNPKARQVMRGIPTSCCAAGRNSRPDEFVQRGRLRSHAVWPRGWSGRGARRRRRWRHNDTRERSPSVRSRVARSHRRAPGSRRRLRAVASIASRQKAPAAGRGG